MQIEGKTDFKSFEKAVEMRPEEVIEAVKKSELKGRGGAGFPTGLKWELCRKCECPERILICNADEGEPGTFKDRFILENNPDTLIEGIAIAAYSIGSKHAYIYLRGEYEHLKETLEKRIKKRKKHLKKINLKIEVFLGAGAYVCGDETAIMDSIQELRGEPRQKPPYPAEKGLCDCPTLINNVETLTNVPLVIRGNWTDLRLFSLSGNVEKPGLYELPEGIPAKELIEKGEPAHEIKALSFGCAGGIIPYREDTNLDTETIHGMGAMLGSCTVIAVDNEQPIPKLCRNIAEFFVHESCGRCTPCREGNVRVLEILNKVVEKKAREDDIKLLEELAEFINDSSFCGLGQASNTHIKTSLKHFREEFR